MNSPIRVPLLFLFLWSSAFIAFEFCSAHAEPATFMMVRTAITAMLLFCIVVVIKASWPKRWLDVLYSAIVGVLIHGIYAGGSFASIHHGMGVGSCALILSLQPLLTVLLSSTFLEEKFTPRKMFGVVAGFLGVAMLILEGDTSLQETGSGFALFMCFVALFAISIGTIFQKRYCSEVEIFPGTCIQFSAAAVFLLPIALTMETMQITWNLSFVLGLGWLIIVISIGAMSLLMILIKHGEAGSVASLFYLVTPMVAIQAWIIFDDKITIISLVGMLICMTGVVVVNSDSAVKRQTTANGTSRELSSGVT